jgi:hypothetical protein
MTFSHLVGFWERIRLGLDPGLNHHIIAYRDFYKVTVR